MEPFHNLNFMIFCFEYSSKEKKYKALVNVSVFIQNILMALPAYNKPSSLLVPGPRTTQHMLPPIVEFVIYKRYTLLSPLRGTPY